MSLTLEIWMTGLVASLALGGIFTPLFLYALNKYLRLEEEKTVKEGERRVPPLLTGMIERLFFTLVIALQLSGAAISMIGWLTLKMVTNWNRPGKDYNHMAAFAALLAGMVSMMFAILGGTIILEGFTIGEVFGYLTMKSIKDSA